MNRLKDWREPLKDSSTTDSRGLCSTNAIVERESSSRSESEIAVVSIPPREQLILPPCAFTQLYIMRTYIGSRPDVSL